MQIQFNQPTTINGITYGKGQHNVPADDVKESQWFIDGLVKDGNAVILREEAPVDAPVASILAGSVKEIIAALEGLDEAALAALSEEEAAGKNRKGVLDAIAASL